jgi:hypothetical protein
MMISLIVAFTTLVDPHVVDSIRRTIDDDADADAPKSIKGIIEARDRRTPYSQVDKAS